VKLSLLPPPFTIAILFSPTKPPPGIHPHPAPGQNAHDPV